MRSGDRAKTLEAKEQSIRSYLDPEEASGRVD